MKASGTVNTDTDESLDHRGSRESGNDQGAGPACSMIARPIVGGLSACRPWLGTVSLARLDPLRRGDERSGQGTGLLRSPDIGLDRGVQAQVVVLHARPVGVLEGSRPDVSPEAWPL